MRRLGNAMVSYIVLSIVFLLLAGFLPANKQASQIYHLSSAQYHLLLFLIILPLMLLAFIAFYGYVKMERYTKTIAKTPEGKDFALLTRGTKWLAWGILVPSVVSIILNAIANAHPGFHATAIIIANYVALLVPLVAFTFISSGAHNLLAHSKQQLSIARAKSLVLIFALIGVAYCYLTFQHYASDAVSSTHNPYFLPLWLMLLTIVIPYLYAWFIGLLAAYEIILFSKVSHGVIYRQALQQMAYGFVLVIASFITLQYLAAIIPRTGHLSLNSVVGLTYAVRLIAAVGYVLIARGAIRLKRIEEV